MATVRPPRKGPMQRQRISEKSFWSYCCAGAGAAAARPARTPVTKIVRARNCIRHLLEVQEDSVCAPALQMLLLRPQAHSTDCAHFRYTPCILSTPDAHTLTTP